MKKLFVLILFVLGCSNISKAQSFFAPEGAEWWHEYKPSYNFYYPFLPQYIYACRTYISRDTTIDGINARVISTELHSRSNKDTTRMVRPYKEFYFYQNVDTVFFYNDIFDKFTPLYIFNAQPGDTICLPVFPSHSNDLRVNPHTGDTSFCFRIDSVKQELFDKEWLNVYYTWAIGEQDYSNRYKTYLDYPTYNWSYGLWANDTLEYAKQANTGKYIEKIIGEFFPKRLVRFAMDQEPLDVFFPRGNIQCYSDIYTDIKLTNTECDYLGYLRVTSQDYLNNSNFKIFPNPANDKLHISFEGQLISDYSIQLLDLSGRTLQAFSFQKNQNSVSIDVSGLANGMYFVQLENEGVKQVTKLVIQR